MQNQLLPGRRVDVVLQDRVDYGKEFPDGVFGIVTVHAVDIVPRTWAIVSRAVLPGQRSGADGNNEDPQVCHARYVDHCRHLLKRISEFNQPKEFRRGARR
jgi:hypothetical protein